MPWNDGRTAIRWAASRILEGIEGITQPTCLLPEYTCDSVILPFEELGYRICYYQIGRELRIDIDNFGKCLDQYKPDAVLIHPYYGCDTLDEAYQIIEDYRKANHIMVIEDLTQSLYLYDTSVHRADFVVASLRKWIPVPDGGFSVQTASIDHGIEMRRNYDTKPNIQFIEAKQAAQAFKRQYLDGGFVDKDRFLEMNRESEQMLYEQHGFYAMSENSIAMIKGVDFDKIKSRRHHNALVLWEGLKQSGYQPVIDMHDSDIVPLYMPIYVDSQEEIQRKLRSRDIYAPVLWPIPEKLKGQLSDDAVYIYHHILALPCDQRYDERDMMRICKAIND